MPADTILAYPEHPGSLVMVDADLNLTGQPLTPALRRARSSLDQTTVPPGAAAFLQRGRDVRWFEWTEDRTLPLDLDGLWASATPVPS